MRYKYNTMSRACIEYHCTICHFRTKKQSSLERHLLTKKHIKMSEENPKFKCPHCETYAGHSSFLRYMHIRRVHKDKTYDKYLTITECKKKINTLLEYFMKKEVDPNEYMNYAYYAKNIQQLSKVELNEFLRELQSVQKGVREREKREKQDE